MMNKGGNRDTSRLLMDRSVPGRVGTIAPSLDVPAAPMPDPAFLRDDLPLPEVSEPEVVQYFTTLSQLNFSIDTHFYPLGSCTMKYNPKINDDMAFLAGFAGIHPLQSTAQAQGALELLYRLQEWLTEITGMTNTSLATLAGAHGELAGVLMMRAYHLARGDAGRTKMAIPDSAHGTNPASAAMAGFDVVTLPSDADGNTDLVALRGLVSDDLAGVMITLPSTLGLFDTNILEVCQLVHDCGGLVYGDGANMNALLGRAKLGALGFDVCHLNLHKTFSTPHGGGGPGAGPVCCGDNLAQYLGRADCYPYRQRRVPIQRTGWKHRKDKQFPRQFRRVGASLHIHPNVGRRWPEIHQRQCGAECQLSDARFEGHILTTLRSYVHARGSVLRGLATRARCQRTRGRETAAGLRVSCSHDVFPAHSSRSVDD